MENLIFKAENKLNLHWYGSYIRNSKTIHTFINRDNFKLKDYFEDELKELLK